MLLSTTELAESLGLHPQTVRRYYAQGRITPAFDAGHPRWDRNAVIQQLSPAPIDESHTENEKTHTQNRQDG